MQGIVGASQLLSSTPLSGFAGCDPCGPGWTWRMAAGTIGLLWFPCFVTVCYHHFRVLTRGLAGSFQPTLLDASSWCSFTSLPLAFYLFQRAFTIKWSRHFRTQFMGCLIAKTWPFYSHTSMTLQWCRLGRHTTLLLFESLWHVEFLASCESNHSIQR